jgi:IS4 transposase
MLLHSRFQAFIEQSPVSVMMRGLVERLFHPERLDQVFAKHAVRGYTRDLPFHTVAEVLSEVVFTIRPTVGAALQDREGTLPVSRKAFYNKLNHIEPVVGAALVRESAQQLDLIILAMKVRRQRLLKKYRTRVLDGNHFAATEHRLEVLRYDTAAPLPGQALVVFDADRRLVIEEFPCEDAHAQERSLLHLVLPTIQPDELWLADRNFCVRSFLFGIGRRKAKFLIRHHANLPYQVVGTPVSKGRTATGPVFEQSVEILDPDSGQTLRLRLITLVLDQPTRDKETHIRLLTNLPARQANACQVAELYRQRWTIESMFQELTQHLCCEIRTLAYPKAALFAFSLALTAWNLLSTITASLGAVHGEEQVNQNLSGYYLSLEISEVTRGMMIAIPEKHWRVFRSLEPTALAELLNELASYVNLKKYQSHPRGPKKPKPQRRYSGNGKHVATARILCR